MHLTTFLYGSDHAEYTKSQFTEDESKCHKRERFVQTNKFCTRKEWRPYTPSSLGGRSFAVVRQASRQKPCSLSFFFDSKACLGCLNGFMVLILISPTISYVALHPANVLVYGRAAEMYMICS